MDFNGSSEPVTLLNVTPLIEQLDQYAGTFGSDECGVVMAMDIVAAPPTPLTASQAQLQYDGYYDNNFCSDPGFLNAHGDAAFLGTQADATLMSSQAASPALSSTTTSGYEDAFDLDSIEEVLFRDTIADLGNSPVPIRGSLYRMDDEPPRKKETAYASMRSLVGYGGTHSTPHSPVSDMRRRVHAESMRNRTRNRFGLAKSPGKLVRANSPMFPDHSTPLSSIAHSPSTNSLNYQDSLFSVENSVYSDPGPAGCRGIKDSSVSSPSALSLQEYPQCYTQKLTKVSLPSDSTNTKSSMEVEMPLKLVRKIVDYDRKILKMQADRSKLLEKAYKGNHGVTTEEDYWLSNERESKLAGNGSESGKVHLYIFPFGIHQLDEPLYDEANLILRFIGGLYFDLQRATANLRNICYKGVIHAPDISTCFAYIKSLLSEKQNLKLSSSSSNKETNVYQIVLDTDSGSSSCAIPQEFLEALNAANNILQTAQHISHAYTNVQSQLLKVKIIADEKLQQSENICQKLGITDREKRTQIHAVLEGNCATMAFAGRVWPQYYHFATDTIRTITECIHPTSQ